MNDQILKLLKQSDFVLWSNEPWKGSDFVDWSSNYDDEIVKYTELVVRKCAEACGSQADRDNILKTFGIPVESKVKYESKEKTGSVTSQYKRDYNIPK